MKKFLFIFSIVILFLVGCNYNTVNENESNLSVEEKLYNIYGFSFELPEDREDEKIQNENYSFITYNYNSIEDVKEYMNKFFINMINNENIKVLAHSIYSDNFNILKSWNKRVSNKILLLLFIKWSHWKYFYNQRYYWNKFNFLLFIY